MLASPSYTVSTSIEQSSFWVFGYSSLCWKPGFSYSKCRIGYVKGYSRKFWQGSTSHRGTETQPGRVATLIEDDEAIVWGCAFEVTSDSPTARQYLETRECSNGGYLPMPVTFYPADLDDSEQPIQTIEALTFIALANNPYWVGDTPLADICAVIMDSEGIAGHNVEYLLRLTDYLRENIPQETDVELFKLESLVMKQIRDRNICLKKLLNHSSIENEREESEKSAEVRTQMSNQNSATSKSEKSVNDDFTHRVPDKKLRCVNI